jgi:hypothetical protein
MPTECGVSECDREASLMRWPWPTRGFAVGGKKLNLGSRALKLKIYSVNDVSSYVFVSLTLYVCFSL